MSQLKTHEENIIDFRVIHGNEYDYPEECISIAFNKDTSIKVICKIHGLFHISIRSHKQGAKCQKCQNELSAQKRTKSFEQRKIEFNNIHGEGRYLYPEETKRAKDKFNVYCPINNHRFIFYFS